MLLLARGYPLRLMNPSGGIDMTRQQITALIFDVQRSAGPVVLVVVATILTMVSAAAGQTFRVLHTFTGGVDGADPQAGLITDKGTHIYDGTASRCGANSFGTVWEITP